MGRKKEFIKKNYKVILGFIIGSVLAGTGVYAASSYNSSDVGYDNKTSGLTATTLQGAIDELNERATTKIAEAKKECPDGYTCIKKNIVAAYQYDSSSCITGEESGCVETKCYENKTAGSCPAGTIIKYKVNDSEEKYFHVLHDDGETLTMQQRENTIGGTAWYAVSDDNTKGPLSALSALESATSSWSNVNYQTYTMGTTNFNGTNAYTGCSSSMDCTTNTYTLAERTRKARMITLQEATSLGCEVVGPQKSCPSWMNNYLKNSTSNGGTVNMGTDYGYWTMSAVSSYSGNAWIVDSNGGVSHYNRSTARYGARAVVVINK